jgi:hypothetical protein
MDLQTKNGVVYWFWRLRRHVLKDGEVTDQERAWIEQMTAKVTDKATGKVVEVNPLTILEGDYIVPSHQSDIELTK